MLEVTQTLGDTHTTASAHTWFPFTHRCWTAVLILDGRDMIWFSKHATWRSGCTAEPRRQRERKRERAGRGHSAEGSVDLWIFWQGMRETMVRRAHSQTPHTLNLYTQLADDQILWSPLSSQHTPTKFPILPTSTPSSVSHPHRAPLMWARAKPCNTKRLEIIRMFAPGSRSLTGREDFSACTPTNFRCGRFALMSRENKGSGSSRPSSLTYTPLGVFSSPEEKIIQRARRENKRKNPVLGVMPQLSHHSVG